MHGTWVNEEALKAERLHFAALRGLETIVKEELDAGIEVDMVVQNDSRRRLSSQLASSCFGNTALYAAVRSGQAGVRGSCSLVVHSLTPSQASWMGIFISQ